MRGNDTAGWDAIERAVAAMHPDAPPLHWGTGATLPGAGVYGLAHTGQSITGCSSRSA